jgi:hypothetical protein
VLKGVWNRYRAKLNALTIDNFKKSVAATQELYSKVKSDVKEQVASRTREFWTDRLNTPNVKREMCRELFIR